jgi:hypothetical protein
LIEFVKSGKLVPVHFPAVITTETKPVGVREATDETISTLLERKIYWQTKLVGGDV